MPTARKVTRSKPGAAKTAKATTIVAKRGTAKAKTAAKPAAKRAATKAPAASSNGYAEISVPAIVKMLKAGHTMTEVRAKYGAGAKIRKALGEAGYNTKGEKVEIAKISGSGKALAAKVARQREAGVAWWTLELATGKTETDLRELLENSGYASLAEGRVVQEREAPAKRTRSTKAAAKTTGRKTAPKAKATATKATTAAKRPARRVRRSNP
jgi:hypothetical protein